MGLSTVEWFVLCKDLTGAAIKGSQKSRASPRGPQPPAYPSPHQHWGPTFRFSISHLQASSAFLWPPSSLQPCGVMDPALLGSLQDRREREKGIWGNSLS